MHKYNTGDEVIISGPEDMNSGAVEYIGFNSEMEKMIGEVHTITSQFKQGDYTVCRIDGKWVWAEEWLQPGNTANFSDEDFALVFK